MTKAQYTAAELMDTLLSMTKAEWKSFKETVEHLRELIKLEKEVYE